MFLFNNKKINMSMIHNAKAHIPVSYTSKKPKPIKNKSIVTIKSNTDVDFTKAKIGIIYVYYERKNEQKNQTNLSFYYKKALTSGH